MNLPTSIDIGRADDHDVLRRVRVVDAATGETIAGVITADAIAGTVRRFEVDAGQLVLKDDSFVIVDEERDIRIEWIVPPIAEVAE